MIKKTVASMTDRELVDALLSRDNSVTADFMFKDMRGTFDRYYRQYSTDCGSTDEFINHIYCLIMSPGGSTHRCGLQTYRYETPLRAWLGTVCRNYCNHVYKRRSEVPYPAGMAELTMAEMDLKWMDRADVRSVLGHLRERHAKVIEYRYLKDMTIDETALALKVTRANCDKILSRARKEFADVFLKDLKPRT